MTEVAFYTLPTRPDAETKSEIEESLVTTLQEVQTIGKASGAAIGWGKFVVPLLDNLVVSTGWESNSL